MPLYNPGPGKGRAMHIKRVRALQALESAGLLDYHHYSTGDGYVLTTAAGERRCIGSSELAPYLAGMLDFYCSLRLDVDATVGAEALERLDDVHLELLSGSLDAVMPEIPHQARPEGRT